MGKHGHGTSKNPLEKEIPIGNHPFLGVIGYVRFSVFIFMKGSRF